MKVWPSLYILLGVVLHVAVLLAPAALPFLVDGPSHTAGFFWAGFLLAIGALFWPHLEARHLLYLLPILLVADLVAVNVFPWLYPEHAILFANEGWSGVARSLVIQGLVSLIVAAGMGMRARYRHFDLRRAGTDREEKERLFAWKQEASPEENLSYLRYSRLLSHGISFIGEQHMRPRGGVNAMPGDGLIFLYDLFVAPNENPEYRREILDALLARRELSVTGASLVFLLAENSGQDRDTEALLSERGFRKIDPDELDTMLAIRQRLDRVMPDEFRGWRPFRTINRYYLRRAPAA